MKTSVALFLGLISCLIIVPFDAQSQIPNGGIAITAPTPSASSYYYAAKPGDLTMLVNIWGFVTHPGRYEVSNTTDLVQLVSFAGGPLQDAKMGTVRISRLIKKDGIVRTKVFTIDLNRLEQLDETQLALYPGDTIFIDHDAWLTVRDVFGVLTTAAILTSAVVQVLSYVNK